MMQADATRVLLVDDDKSSTKAMALLLRSVNVRWAIREAHAGATALSIADEFAPHVALVDIRLPDMSGFELARRLRALRFGHRPVLIALSGTGDPQYPVHARAAGFDQMYVKATDPTALVASIKAAARAHEQL